MPERSLVCVVLLPNSHVNSEPNSHVNATLNSLACGGVAVDAVLLDTTVRPEVSSFNGRMDLIPPGENVWQSLGATIARQDYEFIAILNSGDSAHEQLLEKSLTLFCQDPAPGWVSCWVNCAGEVSGVWRVAISPAKIFLGPPPPFLMLHSSTLKLADEVLLRRCTDPVADLALRLLSRQVYPEILREPMLTHYLTPQRRLRQKSIEQERLHELAQTHAQLWQSSCEELITQKTLRFHQISDAKTMLLEKYSKLSSDLKLQMTALKQAMDTNP